MAYVEMDCLIQQNQVYYASRTHSQLTQVSEELLKLRFSHFSADSVDKILKSDECKVPRAVALASRTHLCINDTLRNRAVDIDEACRDLMNGKYFCLDQNVLITQS